MSSSDRKTIQINPELFQLSGAGKKTRKKRGDSEDKGKENGKIRVKDPMSNGKKPPNVSTIKRNILKMIRNHQYDKKKNAEKEEKKGDSTNSTNPTWIEPKIVSSFETDFNNSLKFLSELTTDVEKKKKEQQQNQTIRRYPVIESHIPVSGISEIPGISEIRPAYASEDIPYMIRPAPVQILPPPKYGCLKNGSLPTYRNWVTQKARNPIPIPIPITNNLTNYTMVNARPVLGQALALAQEPTELDKKIKELSRISQFEKQNKRENPRKNPAFRFPKQKRTIRRTYCIGKSKVHPRVSVLVSNKSIRANTTLKKQELKNIPIAEVRKYLLKHGFIKVGTNSPNDVLREMYENAKLICGEIKNHNPENLLYNYFHAAEEL
jgi:hypothetical protein